MLKHSILFHSQTHPIINLSLGWMVNYLPPEFLANGISKVISKNAAQRVVGQVVLTKQGDSIRFELIVKVFLASKENACKMIHDVLKGYLSWSIHLGGWAPAYALANQKVHVTRQPNSFTSGQSWQPRWNIKSSHFSMKSPSISWHWLPIARTKCSLWTR